MGERIPNILETIFGAKSFFTEISQEHKNVFLESRIDIFFLKKLFYEINQTKNILEPEKLETVLNTAKKFGPMYGHYGALRYYKIATEMNLEIQRYKTLDAFFSMYNHKRSTSLAITNYYYKNQQISPTKENESLDTVRIGIKHFKRNSRAMETIVKFMYAYGDQIDNNFLDQELKEIKEEKKNIHKTMLEYEMQLTGLEKPHCIMYYPIIFEGELSEGREVKFPCF